jgi:hypothetical protein
MYGEKTLQASAKEYYFADIMNPNVIKDRHRCNKCMILWNFDDLLKIQAFIMCVMIYANN